MAFSTLAEARTGSLALRLLCSVEKSGLFLAVDRIVDDKRIRGLFLAESDVRAFVALFEEHKEVQARWRMLQYTASTRWPPRKAAARCSWGPVKELR